jgi:hypothetical protein
MNEPVSINDEYDLDDSELADGPAGRLRWATLESTAMKDDKRNGKYLCVW